MTAPSVMTASCRPVSASRLATSGSSNAPGAHTSMTSSSFTPRFDSPARHPASSRSVMTSLNRPQAMATRRPVPSSSTARPVCSSDFASGEVIEPLEQVAHALPLRPEVVDVLRVRLRLERHAADDLEPEALEPAALRGVVRHEPHRRDPEVDQDLRADAVLTAVDGQPEIDVGVDGVAALVLEPVRAELVADADAAALVAAQVHDDAEPLVVDLLHRRLQLRPAVTAQR